MVEVLRGVYLDCEVVILICVFIVLKGFSVLGVLEFCMKQMFLNEVIIEYGFYKFMLEDGNRCIEIYCLV